MLPLRLTREQVERLYPPSRILIPTDPTNQYNLRMGHRQREAHHETRYLSPLDPSLGWRTAKEAKEYGWQRYQEREQAEWAKLASPPH